MKDFRSLLFISLIFYAKGSNVESCNNQQQGEDPTSEELESLGSGANDIVVVEQTDGSLGSTKVNVMVGKFSSWRTMLKSRAGHEVKIYINNERLETMETMDSGKVCFRRKDSRFRIQSDEWRSVILNKGKNSGKFVVEDLSVDIDFNVFFYDQNSRFVMTDIDGTITESDIKGHVFPIFGFSADHDFVVELFDKVAKNGYNMVYLTARSMSNDINTRNYLFHELQDQNGYSLPFGPVFMSPKTFADALSDSLTDPSPVKAETMMTFLKLFDVRDNVVMGAYGNRNSDTKAYLDVGIPTDKIYLVNEDNVLRRVSDGQRSSYFNHATAVNEMYPKLN